VRNEQQRELKGEALNRMVRKRKADRASDQGLEFTKQAKAQQEISSKNKLIAPRGFVCKTETAEIKNRTVSNGKSLPSMHLNISRCKEFIESLFENGVEVEHKPSMGTLPVQLAPKATLSSSKARHDVLVDQPNVEPTIDDDLGSWREGLLLLISAILLTFLLLAFPGNVDRRLRWCLWPLVSGGIMKAGKALVGI